jgi:hypothetical protein
MINSNSVIRVYFNDLSIPTRMTYASEIQGKLITLCDEPCDANDLDDVKDISTGELMKCSNESFYLNYYEVKNEDIGTPFEDDDIDSIFFEVGTLTR